jgi:hypothetical protein
MDTNRYLRKMSEIQSRYYYDPVKNELTHLRPHTSNYNDFLHVDVRNLNTGKKEHKSVGS